MLLELPVWEHVAPVTHASVWTTTSPMRPCCDGESAVITKQPLSAKTMRPAMPRARRARLRFMSILCESERVVSNVTRPADPARIGRTCRMGYANDRVGVSLLGAPRTWRCSGGLTLCQTESQWTFRPSGERLVHMSEVPTLTHVLDEDPHLAIGLHGFRRSLARQRAGAPLARFDSRAAGFIAASRPRTRRAR